MSAQTYTNPVALTRMARGDCPECGGIPEKHGGLGGPACSLTDNGVAARIAAYQEQVKEGNAAVRDVVGSEANTPIDDRPVRDPLVKPWCTYCGGEHLLSGCPDYNAPLGEPGTEEDEDANTISLLRDAAALIKDRLPREEPERWSASNGWVVLETGEHNCAGGTMESNGAHEPTCGLEPIADVGDQMATYVAAFDPTFAAALALYLENEANALESRFIRPNGQRTKLLAALATAYIGRPS